MENLSKALREVQSKCTGLYRHFNNSPIELVVQEDEVGFITITIGDLFGMNTTHYGNDENEYKIIRFPDNKTLSQMLDNPFEFQTWFGESVSQKEEFLNNLK